jgi:hypothetical protein
MRKVTKEIVKAFMSARDFKLSNSEVKRDEQGIAKMYLFGNLIAERNGNKVRITMAGYPTNTTRERLNGIPNVRISQKNYKQYLNGKEMDADAWYELTL